MEGRQSAPAGSAALDLIQLCAVSCVGFGPEEMLQPGDGIPSRCVFLKGGARALQDIFYVKPGLIELDDSAFVPRLIFPLHLLPAGQQGFPVHFLVLGTACNLRLKLNVHVIISVRMLRTALVIGLVAAMGCGVLSCRRQPSPTVFVDPALAVLVPPDTVALAGVRMKQLSETPLYERWIEKGRVGVVEDFRRRTGLDPTKDLWEFLIANDGKNTVVLIRGKFSDMGQEPDLRIEGATRSRYKSYTIIGTDDYGVLFLNPSTAAAGHVAQLKLLIDRRNDVTALPTALEARIKKIPSTNQAWFVANLAGRVPDLGGEAGMLTGFLRLFRSIQFGEGYLNAREALRAHVNLESGSEKEAEQMRGAIRALLGMGRLNSTQQDREEQSIFDAMQVVREGTVVRFSTDISYDLMERTAAQFPAFRGR